MNRKRTSDIIQQADARAAALRPIEDKLDFGKSLSLAIFVAKIQVARDRVNALNTVLAEAEAARLALDDAEAEVKDLHGRILKAVLVQFGPDSDEYAMIGGTRTSARKRPTRRPEAPTPPSPEDPAKEA
ncbi:MAG: hypothetical protein WCR07_16340 [Verrucomicrobiota bacterium]|jgi:hypothetical protein